MTGVALNFLPARRRTVLAAIIAFFTASSLYAQGLPSRVRPADFPFARDEALGGAHTGLDGDFSSIFTNPAALVGVAPQKTIAKIAANINYIDIFHRMLKACDATRLLPVLFVSHLEAEANIGGPLGLGMIGNNFGFGLFNVTRLGLDWDKNDLFMLSPKLTEEIILAGSYGLRLYEGEVSVLDMGFTVKGFFRAGFNYPPVYLQEIKYILQNLMERAFETQLGAGVDIGFRWTLADSLSFAVVFYDPYSPVWVVQYSKADNILNQETIGNGVVPVTARARMGVSWRIKSLFLDRFFSGVTLSCDYTGMLDNLFETSRDPLLNIGAGLEICMHEVFSIRGGFRDMLPAGGLRLDFTFMNVEISVYGREFGNKPGQFTAWASAIDFTFKQRAGGRSKI
jgi:hypothetical protein